MVRTINLPVEDELYEKITKLKEKNKWTWQDFIEEAYINLKKQEGKPK